MQGTSFEVTWISVSQICPHDKKAMHYGQLFLWILCYMTRWTPFEQNRIRRMFIYNFQYCLVSGSWEDFLSFSLCIPICKNGTIYDTETFQQTWISMSQEIIHDKYQYFPASGLWEHLLILFLFVPSSLLKQCSPVAGQFMTLGIPVWRKLNLLVQRMLRAK